MATVRRMLLVLSVTVGMLVLAPTPSWACSCAGQTTAEYVERADTVVGATLVWTSTNGIERTLGIKVEEVFKGRAAEREKLLTPASEAQCGLGALATDERYLFFVKGEHLGTMSVVVCGGTTLYDEVRASEIAAITGPPDVPSELAAPVTGPVDPDQIEGTAWYTVVGTGLTLAAVLGGLLWLRRKV